MAGKSYKTGYTQARYDEKMKGTVCPRDHPDFGEQTFYDAGSGTWVSDKHGTTLEAARTNCDPKLRLTKKQATQHAHHDAQSFAGGSGNSIPLGKRVE